MYIYLIPLFSTLSCDSSVVYFMTLQTIKNEVIVSNYMNSYKYPLIVLQRAENTLLEPRELTCSYWVWHRRIAEQFLRLMMNRFNSWHLENSQNHCSICLMQAQWMRNRSTFRKWTKAFPLPTLATRTQADMVFLRWAVRGSHKWHRLSVVEHDKETPPSGKSYTWQLFGWCHSWVR